VVQSIRARGGKYGCFVLEAISLSGEGKMNKWGSYYELVMKVDEAVPKIHGVKPYTCI
jgi:hypothetical protein